MKAQNEQKTEDTTTASYQIVYISKTGGFETSYAWTKEQVESTVAAFKKQALENNYDFDPSIYTNIRGEFAPDIEQ